MAKIDKIIFHHSEDDYEVWDGFDLTKEEEHQILDILERHVSEGRPLRGPLRGTLSDIAMEIAEEESALAITKSMIWKGIECRAIRFITDPNMESGTVCAIGDNWFYFGGQTAEDESPEEYLAHTDMDETVNCIYEALEDFRDQEADDEYEYYRLYLDEALCESS